MFHVSKNMAKIQKKVVQTEELMKFITSCSGMPMASMFIWFWYRENIIFAKKRK